jgi:membrane protease YdiL (CAAX protease family)
MLGPHPAQEYFQSILPTTLPEFALFIVLFAPLAGICEETLFRGAIQGILEKKRTSKAVLITALLFAIFHLDPWRFFPVLFLGVIFGTMAVRTNSTVSSMIAHSCTNASAWSMAFGFGVEPERHGYLVGVVLAVFFPIAFIEFLLRTRISPAQLTVKQGAHRLGVS